MNAQEELSGMVLVSARRSSACRVDEDTIVQVNVVNQARMLNKFAVVVLTNFVPIDRPCHKALLLDSILKVGKDLVTMLFSIELIKRYAPKEVSVWEECDTSAQKDHMVNSWD